MRPLPADGDSFRLLELLPAASQEADAPLELKLLEVKLSNDPSYEAVSYTWGPASETESVILDGQHITIRRNLAMFLRRLRQKKSLRRLFADAICINQTDLTEKAAQVQMIGKIFGSAAGVLSWLGEKIDGVNDPDKFFALIKAGLKDRVALWPVQMITGF